MSDSPAAGPVAAATATATASPQRSPGVVRRPTTRVRPTRPAGDLADVEAIANELAPRLEGRRVAIAQEWIAARAGSEKVFEALAALLPEADLFALNHRTGVRIETGGRPIETTALDRPALRDRLAVALPLMPLSWRRLRQHTGRYDVVVTSAHAFARCFARPEDGVHLSYVHSPARYLWFPEVDQRSSAANHPALAPVRRRLQQVDWKSAQATSALAANSETTAARIAEVYQRPASVIHPPVATSFYRAAPTVRRRHLLAFSRFTPYKRLDAAIEVAATLEHPLVVAGSGPDEPRLRQLAANRGAEVEFRIRPTDHELRQLYAEAQALLFFATEDFGIVPVEAQAAGCPVVTCGEGGALDTVIPGQSGVHAASPALPDLVAATQEALATSLTAENCRRSADRFSYHSFAEKTASWLDENLDQPGGGPSPVRRPRSLTAVR